MNTSLRSLQLCLYNVSGLEESLYMWMQLQTSAGVRIKTLLCVCVVSRTLLHAIRSPHHVAAVRSAVSLMCGNGYPPCTPHPTSPPSPREPQSPGTMGAVYSGLSRKSLLGEWVYVCVGTHENDICMFLSTCVLVCLVVPFCRELGSPEEAEGLSDAIRLLFDLESPAVYFCLTCGELAVLSEMKLEDHWEEVPALGMNGKFGEDVDTVRHIDRQREGSHTPNIFRLWLKTK